MGGELRLPLQGVRVVAVEQYIAGPFCTMLMADAGAEVIKIERPGEGDPRRGMCPYIEDGRGGKISASFMEYNRLKRSLSLDLKREEGKEIFKKLVRRSDIVVENFRPGVMDRLGLAYEALREINPALVYVAISGFGQLEGFTGPYSERPAFDIVAEAMSGYMHMIGHPHEPPQNSIYGLADLVTSWAALSGAMMALLDSRATGRGRFVDIAMYDVMVSLNERSYMTYSFTGEVPMRGPEKINGPRGSFQTSDGFIVINIPSDYMWERIAVTVGGERLARDPRFADGTLRCANQEEHFRPIMEQWLADKTMEEAVELLLAAGIPAGEVQTAREIRRCPHLQARRLMVEVEHHVTGPKSLVGSPLKFSGAPPAGVAQVPDLGRDTAVLLEELGYDKEERTRLRAAGIV